MRKIALTLIVSTLFVSSNAWAQAAAKETPRQAPRRMHTAVNPQQAIEEHQAWLRANAPKLIQDWAQLGRYRAANEAVAAPLKGEQRVVFYGDSITDGWKLETYFPGKPYVNRGISGQTTPQMLVRFRPDVVNLKPKAVVILAGTNDIAGNTGPMTIADIEANFEAMADIAQANGIRPVLCSVLPVHDYNERAARFAATRSMEQIKEINAFLREMAQRRGLVYVDYYSAMLDDKGLLRDDLADDGLHPNDAGYRVMVPLVEQGIAKALKPAPSRKR